MNLINMSRKKGRNLSVCLSQTHHSGPVGKTHSQSKQSREMKNRTPLLLFISGAGGSGCFSSTCVLHPHFISNLKLLLTYSRLCFRAGVQDPFSVLLHVSY
ncbi:hypothetical protein AMECASPLE_001396 [Ameca splendens]|uniref:Uncharacterized protein n=1 Tax=Ameca splendens TaxID=208324 RepID=A0ABV0XAV2_9TELE